MKDKFNKGNVLFFLAVISMFLVASFFNFPKVLSALSFFKSVFIKILPMFIAIFVLMILFDLFLKPKILIKLLGKGSGLKGWLLSIGLGVLSSGPVYMWYPLLKDLEEKGLRKAYLASFLHARAVKIPLLPLMIAYFGLAFTLITSLTLLVFAGIQGLIVEKILERVEHENSSSK